MSVETRPLSSSSLDGDNNGNSNISSGIYSKATVHLGLDPLQEKDLLWIAQHATTARLPPNWVQKVINKGEEEEETIFLNEVTR